MAINKVEFGGQTLIDLTADTVSEDKLLSGATAHNKAGNKIQGKAQGAKPEQAKTVEITANGDYPVTPDVGKVLSSVLAKVNVPTGGGGGEEWCNVTVNTMASVGFYGSGEVRYQGTVAGTFQKGFNAYPTYTPFPLTFSLKVLKNSIITLGKGIGFPNISISPNLEYKLNETGSSQTTKSPIMLIYVKGDGTVTA